jgi:hypothetical protein
MSDAKGVEKFAEEFIIGTVGFIYSAATTTATVMIRPIRGPMRFRALKHPEVRPLSAPVAMFLSYLALVFYLSAADIHPQTTKDFLALADFSSLAWYQKLIAVAILYVVSDCLVRIACRLFTRSKRHYYRDCDRLRYAIAGSAVVILIGLSFLALASAFPAYDHALSTLGLVIIYIVSSCLLVVVLGSIMRARFRTRRFVTNALVYIFTIPLIWVGAAAAFGASYAAYGSLDKAIKYEVASSPPPAPIRRVDVPGLLCLIQQDGRLTVSAILQNVSDSVAVFAPDEFSISLYRKDPLVIISVRSPFDKSPLPPPSTPERPLFFRLHTESEFATSIAPHETKLATFTLPLAAKTLLWPIGEAKLCYLNRTQDYALDNTFELGSHAGRVRPVY